MKRLLLRGILYFGIIAFTVIFIICFIYYTKTELNKFIPTTTTLIINVIILGLLFDFLNRVKEYRRKTSNYDVITIILMEPLIRFNEPENENIILNPVDFEKIIETAKKKKGHVFLHHYKVLLYNLYSQRNVNIGLLSFASQISNNHAWLISGLIGTFTKLIEEIEKICRENNIQDYTQINNVNLYDMGFNSLFGIYLDNCMSFSKSKKNIK